MALEDWSLVEHEFDVRHNRHYEGVMALGSGPLQQRASLEEGLSDDPQNREYVRIMWNVTAEQFPVAKSRVGTYLPGATGPHPTCGDEMINLPTLHVLVLEADGERLDMERSRISAYTRRLDLHNGHLHRELTWRTDSGAVIEVQFERFISVVRKHVMVLRCRVRHIEGPATTIRITAGLDADVRTNGFDHFAAVQPAADDELISIAVQTNGGDEVAAAALLTADTDVSWMSETSERCVRSSVEHTLEPGGQITVHKFAALISSRHTERPLPAARDLVRSAATAGFEQLAVESDAAWQRHWEATDVVIEGDPESQHALRVALYHLLRSVIEGDSRVSIDPKAAAGEVYCGRFFWDTEIFMLPMFLYTRPEVGKTLARYRAQTLEGARRNARKYGYSGARYAWESSPAGDEHCPCWQYADHEIHITADVAYGLWHAHLIDPGDAALLAELTEVLTETARYWCQRVHYAPERDEYELLEVMGPDEYTPFSRNNAYTNHMVAQALSLACKAWQDLEQSQPETAATLRVKLALAEDELSSFSEIAAKMRLPYDAERRLVLQSDDFFDYEPFDFARWWPDRSAPLGQSVPQERLYRSQVLKQSDVVQLMALFPHQFDAEQMRIAFETYEPLTSHDSSLSKPVHALLAAWIGKEEEARRLWEDSVGLDLRLGSAAEGVHAANAGACWQVVVFGFAGLRTRMQSDVLWMEPHLPKHWSACAFPFVWCGQPLRIRVRHDRVAIEHRGDESLEAVVYGESRRLQPGQWHVFESNTGG